MRREDFMKPDDVDEEAMKKEWLAEQRAKLERRVEKFAEKALDDAGVMLLINQQATPSADELENSPDLSLGILSQDEKVSVDVQLEINEADQTHEWEITFFLPSVLEGDSVVMAYYINPYSKKFVIPHDAVQPIKDALAVECERIFHHIERNEEENRENYRLKRERNWEIERRILEKEQIEAEEAKRVAEEDAWIKEEVRLLDPLVGSF